MTSVGWLSSSGLGRPTGPGMYHDCAAKQVRTETSRPATSPQMPCGATLVKCPQGSNSFVLNASFLMRGGANPSFPGCPARLPHPAPRVYWSSCVVDALQHNLHECIGVERSRNAIAQASSGSRATTASRRAASWWRFRRHGWVIQRSCGGQRLAASAPLTRRTPGGSPGVENTAQPRVRRLSTLLAMTKVAVGYRPSVAMVG